MCRGARRPSRRRRRPSPSSRSWTSCQTCPLRTPPRRGAPWRSESVSAELPRLRVNPYLPCAAGPRLQLASTRDRCSAERHMQTCSRRASKTKKLDPQRAAGRASSACGKVESLDRWPARDKWTVTYHLKVKETMILLVVARTMSYGRGSRGQGGSRRHGGAER